MKKNPFKFFHGDRKIDKTAFDLSFQNLLTVNFGGLTPLASYPVLPSDHFKIGSNILTKVEPMPAPAFCRIKQNTYAFFTPNQCVWKHWNDYVTNGTAYADTYGNNSNNQKTDNQWRPPQVSVNDIQLISKIANGWVIPVYRVAFATDFVNFLVDALKIHYTDFSNYWAQIFSPPTAISSKISRVCVMTAISLLRKIPEFGALSIFDDIPYVEICRARTASTGSLYWSMDIGCDMVTAKHFFDVCSHLGIGVTQQKEKFSKKDVQKTSLQNTLYVPICLRPFCDNISDDVSDKHGPFRLEKKTYSGTDTDGRLISYYVFKKNLYEDNILEETSYDTENNTKVYRYRRIRKCGYFWSNDVMRVETGNTLTSNVYVPYLVNNAAFNPYPSANPTMDFIQSSYGTIDGFLSDDYNLTLHNFKNTYNEIFYDTTLSDITGVPEIGSDSQLTDTSTQTAYQKICPFNFGNSEVAPRGTEVDGLNFWTSGTRAWDNYVDIDFPLFFDPCTNDTSSYTPPLSLGMEPKRIFFTYESFNLGFDAFSFIVYLCQNCVKLLDYYNIPLEGLTSRSWSFYAGEYLKMLPFFGYSKIWNDYYRNKTTSSAEMDYKETNSEACYDSARRVFFTSCYNSGVKFPEWKEEYFNADVDPLQGWCIPFDCSPKNALKDYNFTVGGTEIHLADVFHFHDLRVRNYWTLLSVLTGAQLYNITLNSICRNYDSGYSLELYGILSDKLYLPSYYNGLLHYKYQNFNKDYFSSALLDPASGANDEQIGSTVSSLVTAQAKQGFWNRIAQNRSVTQFWQSVFGVKPSHNDYDKPLLLGSAHTDVNIGEVVQLSQTDATPQGQRSGLGSAHDKNGLCNKEFNEHGYVLVLVSHTLELQYMQGLERDFTPEESFLDLPFIDFVGLGNQSINQRELNFTARPKMEHSVFSDSSAADGTIFAYWNSFSYKQLNKINNVYPSSPHLMTRRIGYVSNNQPVNVDTSLTNGSGFSFSDIFGYIPRYSTYKFKLDQCHGEFRNSLDFWHSFRRFFTQPILCHEFVNWEFMAENDELGRMFFVQDDSTDKFKLDCFINCTAYRPLPYVCVPATSKS